jgi:hypothetical protein
MSKLEYFDTFAPFGSPGGPGDPWVIGVGVDPLVLEGHLGQDVLLIAQVYEDAAEGDPDLDLFGPFGALNDGSWATWIAGRRPLYVAATTGRSTANDDEPPSQHVPGRLLPFNFGNKLFEGVDPSSRGGANLGVVTLVDPDGVLNHLVGRNWDSTPLILKRGRRGTPYSTWPVIGRYRSAGLVRDIDQKQLRLRDLGEQLETPLHDEFYTGAGELDGDANIAGRWKPWALGACFNVEPVLLSVADQVFQWSRSSSQACSALRHGGVDLDFHDDYPTYADLRDATIPSGHYGTCLAHSLARPNITLQYGIRVDVTGDADTVDGHAPPLTRAPIARRIATHLGSGHVDDVSEIDVSSFQRMEAYHSAPVGWWFGDVITKAAALDRVLAGILGWWRMRPDGRLSVGWLEAPELLTPSVTFDYRRHGMGKPQLVETAPPRRGTRISYGHNYAPQPDRSSLAPSVGDSDARVFGQPARYAQTLRPAIATLYPRAPLTIVEETGFRDEDDAAREAERQQIVFGVERSRWAWSMQVDPHIDLIGAGATLRGAPEVIGEGRPLLCVGIDAAGTSISTFEFFV